MRRSQGETPQILLREKSQGSGLFTQDRHRCDFWFMEEENDEAQGAVHVHAGPKWGPQFRCPWVGGGLTGSDTSYVPAASPALSPLISTTAR